MKHNALFPINDLDKVTKSHARYNNSRVSAGCSEIIIVTQQIYGNFSIKALNREGNGGSPAFVQSGLVLLLLGCGAVLTSWTTCSTPFDGQTVK